ncbi:unnamed protein product [Miscanthus lutarioriparius]|uniref:Anaphase-promoting complex subunit 2 C-terminal domain-containing protein n=1 Tax=Miscanthus lutarioriparius TaxID=422564 RepID=A0A811MG02_9POAL|nr:unnamed protein product [Miscanthus lutarioriparius]
MVSPDNNQLLSDYAKRFHQIKTPRKLLWKKNLGTVKVGKTDLVNGYYENISCMPDVNKNSIVNERLAAYQMTEEEGESSVASVEDQLKKEMIIYEMFCVAESSYDKSLQQLQSFLSGLIADEKLETRDGLYLLKR